MRAKNKPTREQVSFGRGLALGARRVRPADPIIVPDLLWYDKFCSGEVWVRIVANMRLVDQLEKIGFDADEALELIL